MTTMEMMLLLEAGVSRDTLREVEIASRLARTVQAADQAIGKAVDWHESHEAEGSAVNQRAMDLARRVGRMF